MVLVTMDQQTACGYKEGQAVVLSLEMIPCSQTSLVVFFVRGELGVDVKAARGFCCIQVENLGVMHDRARIV